MKAKEKQIRLLMVGLDNAGKTTVVKALAGEEVDEVPPTLGFNIKTLTHRGCASSRPLWLLPRVSVTEGGMSRRYTLNIWDVGGQRTLRPYWRNYFEETEGLVWVVDSTDEGRLEACRDELHALLGEEKLAGASLVVFANKQDVPDSISTERIADILRLDRIGNRHCRVVACSAMTGEGLRDGFDWIVDDVGGRIFLLRD